jgi:hypothetical protein
MAEFCQGLPDAARRGMLLMENKKNGLQHMIRQACSVD